MALIGGYKKFATRLFNFIISTHYTPRAALYLNVAI